MTLYEIDEKIKFLEEWMCDSETGELLSEEEFNKKFDEIQMTLNDKIENSMCFYKSLMAEIEAFKNEKVNLEKRKKTKENLADRIKKRIDNYIVQQYTREDGEVDVEKLNNYKFETTKVKLSYRASSTISVTDINKVPVEFIKNRVLKEEDVMKTEIKKILNNGSSIDGVKLTKKLNMQVK